MKMISAERFAEKVNAPLFLLIKKQSDPVVEHINFYRCAARKGVRESATTLLI